LDDDSFIPFIKISNNSDERNDNAISIFIIRGDDDDDDDENNDNNDENGNDENNAKIEKNRYKIITNSIGATNDASKSLTEYLANLIIYNDRCSEARHV
jgi:hypothetical protein